MPETLFGPWRVEVVSVEAAFAQRLVVTGTTAGDGAHPAVPGAVLELDGPQWTIEMEWNDLAGPDWWPSAVRRRTAFEDPGGWTVRLEVDDNLPELRDGDFDDVVLICTSRDEILAPQIPAGQQPDFTITEDQLFDPPG